MKSLKVLERPVAGGNLISTQFPVLHAIRMGARLVKLVGPVFAALGDGIDLDAVVSGRAADSSVDLGKALPRMVHALAETLKPEEFESLCADLLANSIWTDGKEKYELGNEVAINQAFCGNIMEMVKAIRVVLEVNDFFGFGVIGSLGRGLVAPKAKVSPEGSTQA